MILIAPKMVPPKLIFVQRSFRGYWASNAFNHDKNLSLMWLFTSFSTNLLAYSSMPSTLINFFVAIVLCVWQYLKHLEKNHLEPIFVFNNTSQCFWNSANVNFFLWSTLTVMWQDVHNRTYVQPSPSLKIVKSLIFSPCLHIHTRKLNGLRFIGFFLNNQVM